MTPRITIQMLLAVLFAGLFLGPTRIYAFSGTSPLQSNDQKPSQPQQGTSDSKDNGESSSNDSGRGAMSSSKADSKAAYDPLPAEKDIEIAEYYLRKGDPDAAIPRLEEAIGLQPKVAKPRFLLAQAYEKKKDPANAIKYYREYLQVFPGAPDAKKVQKRIDELSKR